MEQAQFGTGPTGTGPTATGAIGAGPIGTGPTGTGPIGAGSTVTGPTETDPIGAGPHGTGPIGAGPIWNRPDWDSSKMGTVGTAPTGTGPTETGLTWNWLSSSSKTHMDSVFFGINTFQAMKHQKKSKIARQDRLAIVSQYPLILRVVVLLGDDVASQVVGKGSQRRCRFLFNSHNEIGACRKEHRTSHNASQTLPLQ